MIILIAHLKILLGWMLNAIRICRIDPLVFFNAFNNLISRNFEYSDDRDANDTTDILPNYNEDGYPRQVIVNSSSDGGSDSSKIEINYYFIYALYK